MSGSIIPTPDYKADNWQNHITQVEKQRLGFFALSLTNYDSNGVPQIAAGSVIEISGSLFLFSSNDSIGGTPSNALINYIMLEVSGSGDSQTVAGTWTTTAPTWNDAKQGWYDSGGTKRYAAGCFYISSAGASAYYLTATDHYIYKFLLPKQTSLRYAWLHLHPTDGADSDQYTTYTCGTDIEYGITLPSFCFTTQLSVWTGTVTEGGSVTLRRKLHDDVSTSSSSLCGVTFASGDDDKRIDSTEVIKWHSQSIYKIHLGMHSFGSSGVDTIQIRSVMLKVLIVDCVEIDMSSYLA